MNHTTAQDKNQTTTQDKNECYECGYPAARLRVRNNTGPQDCCEEQERPPQTLICDECAEEAALCWCDGDDCGKGFSEAKFNWDTGMCEECSVAAAETEEGYDEGEEDYCNGCDTDVAASTMFNHDDINLCPECNKNKPELIPAGCECEDCEKKPETDDFRRFLAIIHPADE